MREFGDIYQTDPQFNSKPLSPRLPKRNFPCNPEVLQEKLTPKPNASILKQEEVQRRRQSSGQTQAPVHEHQALTGALIRGWWKRATRPTHECLSGYLNWSNTSDPVTPVDRPSIPLLNPSGTWLNNRPPQHPPTTTCYGQIECDQGNSKPFQGQRQKDPSPDPDREPVRSWQVPKSLNSWCRPFYLSKSTNFLFLFNLLRFTSFF